MYLKRKLDIFLNDWFKNIDRLPLIIKGARQVGKTTTILEFAKSNYENVVYINLAEKPKFLNIVSSGYSPDDIIKEITLIDNSIKFVENKTIIIIDEIQENMDITTSLKFFYLDKRYDIICSGSLLGIYYKNISHVSVGFFSEYETYSLDFEEFLWACGYDDNIIFELLDNMTNKKMIRKTLYDKMSSLFSDYIITGGMPQVVEQYISNKSFYNINKYKKNIIKSYLIDIKKYITDFKDMTLTTTLYNRIPKILAKENKKFSILDIDKKVNYEKINPLIYWLIESGIIFSCSMLKKLEKPLSAYYRENNFKIYYNDVGLLLSKIKEDDNIEVYNFNIDYNLYKGGIYENIVAEGLKKSGYELYYYRNTKSTLEVDFVIPYLNGVIPIEVKASNNKSKSLISILNNKDKYGEFEFGIKIANSNISYDSKNNIYIFPHFLVFLINKFLNNLLSNK